MQLIRDRVSCFFRMDEARGDVPAAGANSSATSNTRPHVVVVEILDHLVDQPGFLTNDLTKFPYFSELPSRP